MLPLPDGLAQVCYVVRDLDRAIATWVRTYHAGPFYVADFKLDEGQIYRVHPTRLDVRVAVGYSGALNIELLQPRHPVPQSSTTSSIPEGRASTTSGSDAPT